MYYANRMLLLDIYTYKPHLDPIQDLEGVLLKINPWYYIKSCLDVFFGRFFKTEVQDLE